MPTWDDVVAIGSRLPGVEVGTSYGTPALRVRGKGICRLRTDPYVLVRLDAVDRAELAELLEDAWRIRAPKRLVADYDARGEGKT